MQQRRVTAHLVDTQLAFDFVVDVGADRAAQQGAAARR